MLRLQPRLQPHGTLPCVCDGDRDTQQKLGRGELSCGQPANRPHSAMRQPRSVLPTHPSKSKLVSSNPKHTPASTSSEPQPPHPVFPPPPPRPPPAHVRARRRDAHTRAMLTCVPCSHALAMDRWTVAKSSMLLPGGSTPALCSCLASNKSTHEHMSVWSVDLIGNKLLDKLYKMVLPEVSSNILAIRLISVWG